MEVRDPLEALQIQQIGPREVSTEETRVSPPLQSARGEHNYTAAEVSTDEPPMLIGNKESNSNPKTSSPVDLVPVADRNGVSEVKEQQVVMRDEQSAQSFSRQQVTQKKLKKKTQKASQLPSPVKTKPESSVPLNSPQVEPESRQDPSTRQQPPQNVEGRRVYHDLTNRRSDTRKALNSMTDLHCGVSAQQVQIGEFVQHLENVHNEMVEEERKEEQTLQEMRWEIKLLDTEINMYRHQIEKLSLHERVCRVQTKMLKFAAKCWLFTLVIALGLVKVSK